MFALRLIVFEPPAIDGKGKGLRKVGKQYLFNFLEV